MATFAEEARRLRQEQRTAPASLAGEARALSGPAPVEQAPVPTIAELANEGMSFGERMLVGAGASLTGLGAGIQQLLGLSTPEEQARTEADRALFREGLGSDPAAIAGQVGGALVAGMVPGGVLARAGAMAPRLGAALANNPVTAGAGLAAAEGALDFVGENESRLGNAAMGAAGGALGTAAGQAIGRGVNALRGQVRDPAAAEVMAEGARRGVDVLGSDIGGPGIRRLDTVVERLPGVSGVNRRLNQSRQAGEAANQLRDDLVSRVHPDDELLTPGEAIQGSARRALDTARGEANRLYQQVEDIAATSDSIIQPSNINRAVTDFLEDPGNSYGVDPGLASRISQLSDMENMSFANGIQLRSQLQKEVDRLYTRGDYGDGHELNKIVKAFRSDLDEAATREGGDLQRAYNTANQHFRTEVADKFYSQTIKNALNSENPDTLYKTFLKGTSQVSKPRRLYNALDDRGKNAVRQGMLQEAIDVATVGQQIGDPVFSPARFAQTIERQENQIREMFPAQDADEIMGFSRLMRAVQRAGQVAEDPPTGARNITAGLLGGGGAATGAAIAGPVGAATAAVPFITGGAIRTLTNTAAGRRILAASSDLAPDSPRMQRLVNQALALVGGESARQVSE